MSDHFVRKIFSSNLDAAIKSTIEDYGLALYKFKNTNYRNIEALKAKGYLMLHIESGSGNFKLDLETYNIHNNTICFAYPGQVVSYLNLRNLNGYIICGSHDFLLSAVPKLLDMKLFQLYSSRHAFEITECASLEISNVIDEVEKELNSHEYRKFEILQSLINIHIYKTDRYLYNKYYQLEQELPLHVRKFYTYFRIEQNYNLKVKDYANLLNISPNYLNGLIKKYTGSSVKSLIKKKIIRQACVYLIHTNLDSKEIAYSLGYNSQQYFTSDFKDTIGTTPAKYRNENR